MIVLVAHIYGSIVKGRNISFSEAEYQHGQSLGKPCLVYMPSGDVKVLPRNFETRPSKITKLQRWREELKRRHTVFFYVDTVHLVSQVAADLPAAKSRISDGALVAAASGAWIRPQDSAYLAGEQTENLKSVWVFAPYPLETMPDGFHTEIRRQVAKNLTLGVKYVYFVESDTGVERIAQLVERLAKWAPAPYQEAIQAIRRNVEVCVLDPPSFLTHFTVHFTQTDDIDVFQSVVLPDRNDQQTKLPPPRAREVYEKILEMFSNTIKLESNGLIVRKKVA